ncbi:MAG: VanZ family protein, partial [Muribaculaceae bacterium]|nr:VanZ family protein [Muribaculaceae bacterium]
LFPGADKVVHAMMFGFLAIMILFDRQRKDGWRTLSVPFIFLGAALSILMGVGIEVAQLKMDMGRGYEVADMVADAVGVAICSLSWILLQHRWSNRS